MRTFADTKQLISEVEVLPYLIDFDCIECGMGGCDDMSHVWYIQARLWRRDTDTGEEGWGQGSIYPITAHMSMGEVVKKCYVAAESYAIHEVREAFKWRGRRILGPHIDIEALWKVANDHG